MAMLKDSIPFWEQFNSNVSDLSQWLAGVNADLSSENVQFWQCHSDREKLNILSGTAAEYPRPHPHGAGRGVAGGDTG